MNKKLAKIFLIASLVIGSGLAYADDEVSPSETNTVESVDLGENRDELLVNSFKIEGLENVNIDNVLSEIKFEKDEVFDPNKVNTAIESILKTGYFSNVIPEINRDADNKTVDIILKLVEFPKISSIEIEGNTKFSSEEILKSSELKIGEVFNEYKVINETSPIVALYNNAGIISANIASYDIDDEGNLLIIISEGVITKIVYEKTTVREDNKRFSASRARIKTQDYILDRMNQMKTGEILTKDNVEKTLRAFFRTGLFSSVSPRFDIDPIDPDGRIVTIVLEERPTTSINAQVSYQLKEGFTGGIKLEDNNFFGRNQRASIELNFGTRGNFDVQTSFFDPWIYGTDNLQVGANIYVKRTKNKQSDLIKDTEVKVSKDNFTLSGYLAQYNKELESYSYGLSGTVGKGFLNGDIFLTVKPKISAVQSKNSYGNNLTDYMLIAANLGLTYDTRNDSYLPTSGIYVNLSGEVSYVFKENSMTSKSLNDVKNILVKIDMDIKSRYIKEALDSYTAKENADENQEKKNDVVSKYEAYVAAKEKYSSASADDKSSAFTNLSQSFEKLSVASTALSSIEEDYKLKLEEKNKTFETDAQKQVEIEKPFEFAKDKLKRRAFFTTSLDLRAFHPMYKQKNSMAYRLMVSYATPGTPSNMLFTTDNGGTSLRAYQGESTNASMIFTAENRTHVSDYLQFVLFFEAGTHTKAVENKYNSQGLKEYQSLKYLFSKENFKADIGVGARVNTPLGVLRLDYAFPLANLESNNADKKGKFTFGFGQTF